MNLEQEIIRRIKQLESEIHRLTALEASSGGTSTQDPAEQIKETSGPTTLDIGAISDGQFIKRNGTNVVGSAIPAASQITDGTTTHSISTISDGEYLKRNGSNIVSGKPWQPRVYSTASTTTPTPNSDSYDMFVLTALAGNATFGSPSGSPAQGQKLLIRIKDDGTARTLSWNTVYRAVGVSLPTTTKAGKTLYVGFVYNSTDSKWDCVAKSEEA